MIFQRYPKSTKSIRKLIPRTRIRDQIPESNVLQNLGEKCRFEVVKLKSGEVKKIDDFDLECGVDSSKMRFMENPRTRVSSFDMKIHPEEAFGPTLSLKK